MADEVEKAGLDRSELAFLMLCAWNNIAPEDAPAAFRAFTDPGSVGGWRRVEAVARAHLEARATRAEARVARAEEVIRQNQKIMDWLGGEGIYCEDKSVPDPSDQYMRNVNFLCGSTFPDDVTHLPPTENAAVAEHLSEVEANKEAPVPLEHRQ